jgi:hypothetical protein
MIDPNWRGQPAMSEGRSDGRAAGNAQGASNIETMQVEERRFEPSPEFSRQANAQPDIYKTGFDVFIDPTRYGSSVAASSLPRRASSATTAGSASVVVSPSGRFSDTSSSAGAPARTG